MKSKEDLRDKVARDLKPVRPLLPPATRALALAPLALATVAGLPLLQFFRSDMAALGFWRAWGLSLLEVTGGLVVVALALRESVPGRSLSRRALALAFIGGLALPVAVFALTANNLTIGSAPGAGLSEGAVCFRNSAVAALPALLLTTLLVARAFPLRPWLAGALYGLGCGEVADAGLRLFCEYTVPAHVLFAHGGAVVFSLVAGAIVAQVFQRPGN